MKTSQALSGSSNSSLPAQHPQEPRYSVTEFLNNHCKGPTITMIRKGHRIQVWSENYNQEATYEVVGSRSLRGKYLYILRDVNGHKFSMSRKTVILGQQNGTIRIAV